MIATAENQARADHLASLCRAVEQTLKALEGIDIDNSAALGEMVAAFGYLEKGARQLAGGVQTPEDIAKEIERAEIEGVRMLDQWIMKEAGRSYEVRQKYSHGFAPVVSCELFDSVDHDRRLSFEHETPQGARGAAAESIRGDL